MRFPMHTKYQIVATNSIQNSNALRIIKYFILFSIINLPLGIVDADI